MFPLIRNLNGMDIPKPSLQLNHSCRRELLWSSVCSVIASAVIVGVLAMVSLSVTSTFFSDEVQPLIVNTVKSDDRPIEEVVELSLIHI